MSRRQGVVQLRWTFHNLQLVSRLLQARLQSHVTGGRRTGRVRGGIDQNRRGVRGGVCAITDAATQKKKLVATGSRVRRRLPAKTASATQEFRIFFSLEERAPQAESNKFIPRLGAKARKPLLSSCLHQCPTIVKKILGLLAFEAPPRPGRPTHPQSGSMLHQDFHQLLQEKGAVASGTDGGQRAEVVERG